ncbi:MAG TPA: DUF5818 domain-containing protein [Candidatus Sulfotelmatobacter sp.]
MLKLRMYFIALPTAVILFVFIAAPRVTVGQAPPAYPAPEHTGVIGPQLIAWSMLQKPQPVPQQPEPIPTPDKAQPTAPPSQDQPSQKKDAQPEPKSQQTMAQSVVGTIAKVSSKCVLQTSQNITYQLDDQDKAAQYIGKRVKVTGTLNRATSTIRVRSIELLS